MMAPNRFLSAARIGTAVIIIILALIALPNLLEKRPKVYPGRTRSDMRSLATAIETYYVDHGVYPAFTRRSADQVDAGQYKDRRAAPGSTFRAVTPTMQSLTTPIAYITSYFPDPFADTKGTTFRYYADAHGWILGSWGPDRDEATGGQMKWDGGIEKIYDGSLADPLVPILTGAGSRGAYNYDPTNGTVSAGDLWRVAVPLGPPAPRKVGP